MLVFHACWALNQTARRLINVLVRRRLYLSLRWIYRSLAFWLRDAGCALLRRCFVHGATYVWSWELLLTCSTLVWSWHGCLACPLLGWEKTALALRVLVFFLFMHCNSCVTKVCRGYIQWCISISGDVLNLRSWLAIVFIRDIFGWTNAKINL